MSILDNLNEAVKIDYTELTPEMLSDIMKDMDREITRQGPDYVMYTNSMGMAQFERKMANHRLVETLKNL